MITANEARTLVNTYCANQRAKSENQVAEILPEVEKVIIDRANCGYTFVMFDTSAYDLWEDTLWLLKAEIEKAGYTCRISHNTLRVIWGK